MIDNSSKKMEEQRRENLSHDTNNNTNSRSEDKYGLRPRTIIKRLQQERVRQEVPKRPSRTKSRPAPLSKYRRKTANARERHRMREINNAFESLRKVLPDATMEVHTASSTMTKITTLRLAVDYIRTLSKVLEDDGDTDLCSLQSTLQTSIQNSLQHSLQNSLQHSHQHSLQQHLQKNTATTGIMNLPYSSSHFTQQYMPQLPHHMSYCSSTTPVSASSSPSTLRESLSSASDLEDLLSDDSGLLEDNLDVFHDIPTLYVSDPFDIILEPDKDTLSFSAQLCG